jgi:mannonate dehydratase
MKYTMRWFGPNDPVSLMDIRQSGCSGVVSALHQIPIGQVWTLDEILERKKIIEKENDTYTKLTWDVVESLPVHEDIKKGLPTRKLFIENYKTSLENLAKAGIFTVCYNFMPVLDWSRTNLNYEMPDGSKALRFVWLDFAIFDLFILKRPNAEKDYSDEIKKQANTKFAKMTQPELETLKNTALLGLPGSEEAFELETFQGLLDNYKAIGAKELKENLFFFISEIAPFANSLGIKLCIHPDDPPFPLLGLPRVVSTFQDLKELMEASNVKANGITFCTGSLGVRADNPLAEMVRAFGDRIHFVHLRTTRREADPENFHEAAHLDGDVDMYEVVKGIVEIEKITGPLPMRPDHGHQMLDDLNKKTYPGYSAIGRLKGLAEIRGLEMGIRMGLK